MRERLQKFLARSGICSRRQAETLISQGRVAVNGRLVSKLGSTIDPERDKVTLDGRPVVPEKTVYILLNKPRGYLTTLSDPQGRPIVTDLLPDLDFRVFPVGRLDLDSEGALLLTNDGELANHILHPRYGISKTYEATVRGRPSRSNLNRLEEGIILEGRRTLPATLRILRRKSRTTTIEIVLHEGRKRQVRKMFAAIGHPVIRLKRTAYGNLGLDGLPTGMYRFLSKNELKKLFSGKIPFTIKNILA